LVIEITAFPGVFRNERQPRIGWPRPLFGHARMAYWLRLPLLGLDDYQIKRREFIAALGGAAAWLLVARVQLRERLWRIGVIMLLAKDGSEQKVRAGAFLQELQSGWG
jgi:hypothetical protein